MLSGLDSMDEEGGLAGGFNNLFLIFLTKDFFMNPVGLLESGPDHSSSLAIPDSQNQLTD